MTIVQVRTAREVGAAIRRNRRRLGWSQGQLADAMGASRAWVVAVEQGKPGAELQHVLRALAALGVTLDLASNSDADDGGPDGEG